MKKQTQNFNLAIGALSNRKRAMEKTDHASCLRLPVPADSNRFQFRRLKLKTVFLLCHSHSQLIYTYHI